MAINKVVYGNDTLVDLTEDSVTANTLLEGETAHNAAGEQITGTAKQGHVVKNASGTSMTQRRNLQFVDAGVTDDSTGDVTKVNIIRTMTKAEMDSLSSAEKAGFIRTSDEADNPYVGIDASDVIYGSGTVKDALDGLTNSDTADVTTGAGTGILFHLIKKGNMVYLWIESGTFTANANETLVQLPSGFFPVSILDVRDTYSNKRLNINTDGTLVCKEGLSGTILRGTFLYMC